MAVDQHRKDPPSAAASAVSHNRRLTPTSLAPKPPPSLGIEDSSLQELQNKRRRKWGVRWLQHPIQESNGMINEEPQNEKLGRN